MKTESIINGKRKCKSCEEIKLVSEFTKSKEHSFGIKPICKKCWARKTKERRNKNIENYRKRERIYCSNPTVKQKHSEYKKNSRKKLRKLILEHYSGNPPKCACCGELHNEFLQVDHINGGGKKHLKKIGQGNLYRWLLKKHFPIGFRILCCNCNRSLGNYGYCPHQKNVSQ